MANNPMSTSGVNPSEPVPPYGPENPRLGAGEEAQEPKPFSLPPEGAENVQAQPASNKPTPMEVAGDAARQQQQLAPEELGDQISKLQNQLGTIQGQLQDSNVTKNFTTDHFTAMQQVAGKMNPDMQNIAKYTNGQFNPTPQQPGQGVVGYITQWLNGAQGTLGGALNYLQNTEKPDIASYFKLQYAVQRATQRGELFASIVSSSVSGIKTIMSTQLG